MKATKRIKNSRKTKIFALSAVTALLISGCSLTADVPDELKDSSSQAEEVADSVYNELPSEDLLVYKPVAEAVAEAGNVIGNKYQNLNIPDDPSKIEVSCDGALYNINTHMFGMSDEQADELAGEFASDFFGIEQLGERVDDYPNCRQYKSDDFVIQYYSGSSILAYRKDDLENYISKTKTDEQTTYVVGRDNIEGVSYIVAGEEYLLTDALEYVNSILADERLTKYMPMYNGFKVKTINVFMLTNGEYVYNFDIAQMKNGVEFSTAGTADSGVITMGKVSMDIIVCAPGRTSQIASEFQLYPTNESEIDEIITLDSALNYAEAFLAPYKAYDIKKISLRYCVKRTPQTVYPIYKPMWCLTVDELGNEWRSYRQENIIYIDCQTGDIFMYDAERCEFIF